MYEIIFYSDKDGYSQLLEYIAGLERRTDKDSRIKLKKIHEHITMLANSGTLLPSNIAKHLDGEIWELRPIRDRILFAGVFGDSFVLLHSFMKKTQKTPKREIEQAKRELEDFKDRNNNSGNADKGDAGNGL